MIVRIALILSLLPSLAATQSMTEQVRNILNLTTNNWVAVRDFDGQDLLYFTHLLSYRCVLSEICYAINTEDAQVFNAKPCPEGMEGQMFAPIAAEDSLPYLTFAPGSIETVTVSITYDDGAIQTLRFNRADVMTP